MRKRQLPFTPANGMHARVGCKVQGEHLVQVCVPVELSEPG